MRHRVATKRSVAQHSASPCLVHVRTYAWKRAEMQRGLTGSVAGAFGLELRGGQRRASTVEPIYGSMNERTGPRESDSGLSSSPVVQVQVRRDEEGHRPTCSAQIRLQIFERPHERFSVTALRRACVCACRRAGPLPVCAGGCIPHLLACLLACLWRDGLICLPTNNVTSLFCLDLDFFVLVCFIDKCRVIGSHAKVASPAH